MKRSIDTSEANLGVEKSPVKNGPPEWNTVKAVEDQHRVSSVSGPILDNSTAPLTGALAKHLTHHY